VVSQIAGLTGDFASAGVQATRCSSAGYDAVSHAEALTDFVTRHQYWRFACSNNFWAIKQRETTAPLCMHSFLLFGSLPFTTFLSSPLIPASSALVSSLPTTGLCYW